MPSVSQRTPESQRTLVSHFLETADIETSSDDYAQRFSGNVGAWFLHIQEQATLRMLTAFKGGTVLDVGGGHGQLTQAFVQHGYEITVLGSADICQQRIRQLVEDKRCTFQVGNILDLPYPAQAFDIVVSYRLLPHVTRWQQFLAELTRVARRVVMVDYPAVHSVNYLAPLLFSFKKRLEGNTRPFTSFREAELLNVFHSQHFRFANRYPEFFFPMVLHRVLQSPRLSSLLEQTCRLLGLTAVLGSPVILQFNRMDA